MEPDTVSEAPKAPAEDTAKPNNNSGLKAVTLIASILAICGIGFGVYGMMYSNNKNPGSSSSTEASSSDQQSLNVYEINDLKQKVFRLLGSRNGFSIKDYYNKESNNFLIYNSYIPTLQLFNNELENINKVYLTLETTILDKEKNCGYRWQEDVEPSMKTALGANNDINPQYIDCISYDEAKDDYYSLWGETLPKIETEEKDLVYISISDTYYYHIIGGRGGTCSDYIVGKIKNITRNQELTYVDINAGLFDTCAGYEEELLYSDVEKEELYKTIAPDSINWDGLGLTENDYESFQPYRFIFKKNSDGIYSFSSIEKM